MVSGFRIDLLESNSGDSMQQLTPETDANLHRKSVVPVVNACCGQFQTFSRSKRSNRLRRSKAGIRHVARGNRQKLIVCDVPDCPHHVVERGVRRMDAVQESDLGSCVSIDLFFSTIRLHLHRWSTRRIFGHESRRPHLETVPFETRS